MAGRGHAAERSKRLKDSKRFKLILETTQCKRQINVVLSLMKKYCL